MDSKKFKNLAYLIVGVLGATVIIIAALIRLEEPRIPIRATQTAEWQHTQVSITQTNLAKTQTPKPAVTETQLQSGETNLSLTPTDYIYDNNISIVYIGHANEDNPEIRKRLTDLGFTVTKLFLDYYDENDDSAVEAELLKYDIAYFPSGWSQFMYEITDYRAAFVNYISTGHGIFVQEANSSTELTTVFLPFDVEFYSSAPMYQKAEILNFEHFIFGNLKNKEYTFMSRDYVRNYDDFTVLAQGKNSDEPSLLLSQYNLGRILIFLPDITKLELNNQNDTLIKNMFYWLDGEVD